MNTDMNMALTCSCSWLSNRVHWGHGAVGCGSALGTHPSGACRHVHSNAGARCIHHSIVMPYCLNVLAQEGRWWRPLTLLCTLGSYQAEGKTATAPAPTSLAHTSNQPAMHHCVHAGAELGENDKVWAQRLTFQAAFRPWG